MTKIDMIPFGDEDRPQFQECPRSNFEKHPNDFFNTWSGGTPVVMCEMNGTNHTCEWRHKKGVPEEEKCPLGAVF